MARLLALKEVEADRARLGPLRPDAATEGLLRVFGHQALELGLGPLMLQMRFPGAEKDVGKLSPSIGGAHIDNADCLHARLWRIDPEQAGRLTALNTAPELPLGGDD